MPGRHFKQILIQTKLNRPAIGTKYVERPRLVSRLDEAFKGHVTLISAPAGYGKTTLVLQWLDHRRIPAAWFAIDEMDSDPDRFLRYVVAAVRTVFPEFGSDIERLLSAPQLPPPEHLADAMVNELAALNQPLLIVLDDYHRLASKTVHEIMTRVLPYLPDARLVWSSSRGAVAAGLVTFLSALFIPLQWTIFLGAGLSMILYIYVSATHVKVRQLVRTQDGKYEERDVPQVYPSNQATVLVFEGNQFFAEVPFIEELLPSRQGVKNAVVILRARHQETVPSTALKWLKRYTKELHQSGNLLILAGVEPHAMQELDKAGLLDQIGKENVFASGSVLQDSLNEVLDVAEAWLKKEK